jgi:hypothetical protein
MGCVSFFAQSMEQSPVQRLQEIARKGDPDTLQELRIILENSDQEIVPMVQEALKKGEKKRCLLKSFHRVLKGSSVPEEWGPNRLLHDICGKYLAHDTEKRVAVELGIAYEHWSDFAPVEERNELCETLENSFAYEVIKVQGQDEMKRHYSSAQEGLKDAMRGYNLVNEELTVFLKKMRKRAHNA